MEHYFRNISTYIKHIEKVCINGGCKNAAYVYICHVFHARMSFARNESHFTIRSKVNGGRIGVIFYKI